MRKRFQFKTIFTEDSIEFDQLLEYLHTEGWRVDTFSNAPGSSGNLVFICHLVKVVEE